MQQKVMIIGSAPLPNDNTVSRPAAGLRTFQFVEGAKRRGHEVFSFLIGMSECYAEEKVDEKSGEDFELVGKDNKELMKRMRGAVERFKPDVVVGVNTYPSSLAAQVVGERPFWADLNGWIMSEAQVEAFKKDSNAYLPHYWKMESAVLERADMISVVSEPQMFAVIGELGAGGRLGKESFGAPSVVVIKNATERFETDKVVANQDLAKKIPENTFNLMWLGGYNTWVDEETLFKGVADAMKEDKEIQFVSTGGRVSGLDNNTFSKFKALIDASEMEERFTFLGWVDTKDIPYIYSRVHCGLNVDRMCVETLTGARNRLNEMMKFGLPIITTAGSEIAKDVADFTAGISVESENSAELTKAILKMKKNSEGYGECGKRYTEHHSYKKVLEPLFNWLKKDKKRRAASSTNLEKRGAGMYLKYLKDNGVKKSWKKLRKLR